MQKEIEAKFLNINVQHLQENLKSNSAKLTQARTLFRRIVYFDPQWGKESFLRLRDEGDKITITYKKVIDKTKLDWVLESEIQVTSFDDAKSLLSQLWFIQKAYQETYRETRNLMDTSISIDERPWLNPFMEIEWKSNEEVEQVAKFLWFEMNQAVFGSVSEIYVIELWLTHDQINHTPVITFDNIPSKQS